jgi:glucosylceramidase
LTEQPTLGWITPAEGRKTDVAKVDPAVGFQTMLGMGSSFGPSTCWNLSRLTPAERDQVMERLVKPMIGGVLLPQNYAADAEYFASFIQAYEAEGIRI